MKETITSLIRWLINRLNRIVTLLENQNLSTGMPSKFVDLAPTDRADKAGVYSEALLFATKNAKVSNIALTGPYGSGKSSIIQSFLTKYRMPTLHISLAAFSPEGDSGTGKVNRQDIERSILQQMLYGADANNLPLSRFKRIQSPNIGARFKSLYIMLGIVALSYVFLKLEDIFSGYFSLSFTASNWFNLLTVFFAATFLWATLHHFYVASFGLSLKSISLKDVEIKPADDDQTSILNRHLDEIIYFFQSTKYELVIIEDLDRFEDADIFVTLREINRLVNENAGVKRSIRFLYALRDDMFINIDRTKFFEFIIPVIPIINTSNSIDMVLEQGRRLELDARLDRQFLREVSRYLDDLRLIQNIFNEYAVYVSNLETDGEAILDANKLLAILIYKNVYPRDFEQLHRGEGTLSNILNLKDSLIKNTEDSYRKEIADLEKSLEIAEHQTPSDLRELRQIYAMALIEKLPTQTSMISLDQQTWIELSMLPDHDTFEQLIGSASLMYRTINGGSRQVDRGSLQGQVESGKIYLRRKKEIEHKEVDNKTKSLRRIHDIRSAIARLRTTAFNEKLRLNLGLVTPHFDSFGENKELVRFLILEGYLDDSYYQYTSLFHAGRLSPNDNKFLIQIRAFTTPEPSFTVDNPEEVIEAMREEDFRQSYILNVNLVDCLMSDQTRYRDKTKTFFEFLSSDFDSCECFLDAYYTSGRNVERVLSRLANSWKGLVPTVIASRNNISHVSQMLSHLSETMLKKLARDFDELLNFVSDNLPDILANLPELAPQRLALLDFEVKDLTAVSTHTEIVRFMFEKGLFKLTIANLEYVYQELLGKNDLETMRKMNFTTIRSANNLVLMSRVERDFNLYLSDVLLKLHENSEEDVPSILSLINNEILEQENVEMFLERQTNLLPFLEDVPQRFQSMLFRLGKIEATWLNCLNFLNCNGFEPETLIGYLERDVFRTNLLKYPLPKDQHYLKLCQFIFNAETLSDGAYRDYNRVQPWIYKGFPTGITSTKLRILIDERKVVFNKASFDELSGHSDLQVRFVKANIKLYLTNPEKFELDDDFLEELLRTEIDDSSKIKVIELMNLDLLVNKPERAGLIGNILNNLQSNLSGLDSNIIQSLVTHSSPTTTQISLLNRYNELMSDDDVRYSLTNLPIPYCEITTGRHVPKLKNTPENQILVRWLESRKIISSWSDKSLFSDEIKVNLKRV